MTPTIPLDPYAKLRETADRCFNVQRTIIAHHERHVERLKARVLDLERENDRLRYDLMEARGIKAARKANKA